MANVNIKFNGKDFLLSCDDGQEEHLENLANHLSDKFDKLKDGYVVLDSKSNLCYFKKLTLDKFIKKSATKVLNQMMQSIK